MRREERMLLLLLLLLLLLFLFQLLLQAILVRVLLVPLPRNAGHVFEFGKAFDTPRNAAIQIELRHNDTHSIDDSKLRMRNNTLDLKDRGKENAINGVKIQIIKTTNNNNE
jgi:hypothetical protein